VLTPLLLNRKDNLVERLIERLTERGMTLAVTRSEGTLPTGAQTICTRTHTIEQVLSKMLKESDNLYAEAMFYQLAASGNRKATAKTGREQVNRLIQKMGMNPGNYYIADGSGLSLYNYVSPELEVAFLRYVYRNGNIYSQLLPSMPIAGVDGTLENRMRTGFARGNVKAKTGTVTGVSALAGYLTAANGHRLCFSIINQGQRKATTIRPYQDRICEALCKP
jgi:D-alanyl-D-alanine carboxypeptidase/D-alanyl-D-alanine-endopeptidase (penicillin-binding protein 4)